MVSRHELSRDINRVMISKQFKVAYKYNSNNIQPISFELFIITLLKKTVIIY